MISSYGSLVAAGVLVGTVVMWMAAPRVKMARLDTFDLAFWAVVGGIVGARALFVGLEWPGFATACRSGDCLAWLRFWEGGWVFLGGVLGAIPAVLIYLRVKRLDLPAGFALLGLAMPIGHVFGRVGCWVKGCCHGKRSAAWVGYDGRHPAQLYEAGGEVLIFLATLWWFRRVSSREDEGTRSLRLVSVPVFYLTLYSVLRLCTEVVRGDQLRGFVFTGTSETLARIFSFAPEEPVWLSTSQFISLCLLLVCLFFWGLYLRRTRGRVASASSM